jgi:mannose-1-phosphate guanylyltransferase
MKRSRTEASSYAVIMAGGSGTRFWPLSRTHRPKQLLNITGDEILLKKAVERIEPIIPPERIKIVTTRSQAGAVGQIIPEKAQEDIILEPSGRNTAPAIGISALYVERDDSDAVMVVLPADHYIEDHAAFRQVIMAAIDKASQGDCIVTIGISPRGPETGYGYIEVAKVIDKECAIYSVKSFHEKPGLQRARDFIKRGKFFWNSGILIAKASTMLREIGEHLPHHYKLLMDIRSSLGTDDEQKVIGEAYEKMEAISIDYGMIEKSRNVLMVEGNFEWDDVGCWPSAAQYWPHDSQDNACIGEVVNLDSSRCIVHSPKKPVALLGVEDLIIVEEDDVLLVCRRDRSQDVRRLVEILRSRGRDDIL